MHLSLLSTKYSPTFKFKSIDLLRFTFLTLCLISCLSQRVYAVEVGKTEQNYEEALLSFQEGEYKTSIIHLKNILANNKVHLPSRVLLAENLIALGDGSGAEIELNNAKKGGAATRLLEPLFTRAYLLQNKFDDILNLPVSRNMSATYQSQLLALQGLAWLGKSDTKNAALNFNESLSLFSSNVQALLGKARIALLAEDNILAQDYINKALTVEPEHQQALLMAAITAKLLQNNTLSLQYAEQLIELNPNNYAALLVRAVLLIDKEKHAIALNDINKIIVAMPNEPIVNYIKIVSSQAVEDTKESAKTQHHLDTLMGAIPDEMMEEQPIYYFLDGIMSFQNGTFESAEKAFLKYHDKFPKDIRVLRLLGQTEMVLGNSFLARKFLVKAYLLDENDVETWSLLGRANMMTGNVAESEFYFQKALNHQSSNFSAQLDLAKLYLLQAQYQKVINLLSPSLLGSENLEQRAKVNPRLIYEMQLALAKSYQLKQDFSKSLLISESLITNFPYDSQVYLLHASTLGLSGDITQSKHYLNEAIKLDSTNLQAIIFLARIDAAEGNGVKAIERLKRLNVENKNSGVYIEIGNLYQHINQNDQALSWYQKALALDAASLTALEKVVQYFEKKQDVESALSAVTYYLSKFDKNSQALAIAAKLYMLDGQNEKGLDAMRRAVKYGNNKSDLLVTLAEMQIYNAQRTQAVISLERSISLDKAHLPSYNLLIHLYSENNETDKSLRLLKGIKTSKDEVSRIPTFALQRLTGDVYAPINVRKAEHYYKNSYELSPNKPALLGLYKLYKAENHYTQIINLLANWIAENPNDLSITLALGEAYRDSGELDLAAEFYSKHINNNPNNIQLLNNAAMIFAELQSFETASNLAERAYTLAPKNVNILDTKAWVLYLSGDYKSALSLLRQAHTLDYDNAEVKYHLALTLDKLNRRQEALRFLQESVMINSEYSGKDKALVLLKSWQK